ncbi:MAG: DsbA family protein [Pseudomonadota bacterium]|nr:DsbA family protein [Pseudomonadota bacterium]
MFRAVLLAVLVSLSAVAVARADEAPVTDRAGIETIVREYLLKHPEVIVEALQAMQAREEQARLDQQKSMIAAHAGRLDDGSNTFVLGNPAGDVTIVEFFDYRCGYCKRVLPGLIDTVQRDGKVRLVMKEFPILGEDSVIAAKAAIAAAGQGRYADMHLALMAERGGYTEEKVLAIGKDLGLDVERMRGDMASPATQAVIEANYGIAQALQINGTPAFIIGNDLAPGAIPPARIQEMIAAARAAKG